MGNGDHGTSSDAAGGSCDRLSEEVLRGLEDGELYRRTQWIAGHQNELEAQLIVCLGEIEKRKLYAKKAFSSLFYFCTRVLGLSEDVAMARITVARAALEHPEVVEALREGRVHLTGLRLLAPHLTAENCSDLISRASGQTKRRIEEIVAGLNPKADRTASIRRQPRRRRKRLDANRTRREQPSSGANGPTNASTNASTHGTGEFDWGPADGPDQAAADEEEGDEDEWETPLPRPPRMDPLSEERFWLQVTISRELRDKIELASDLLSHCVRKGDLEGLLDRSITLLIDERLKERFGVGRRPRASKKRQPDRNGPDSRDIPVAIARAVYLRDGGRCAFVDDEGRRCSERAFLQLHHLDGFTFVKEHRVERIELRCATHNQRQADDMFGREYMDARRQGK